MMSLDNKVRSNNSNSGYKPGMISISMVTKDKSNKREEDGVEADTSIQKQLSWAEIQVSEKLQLLGY